MGHNVVTCAGVATATEASTPSANSTGAPFPSATTCGCGWVLSERLRAEYDTTECASGGSIRQKRTVVVEAGALVAERPASGFITSPVKTGADDSGPGDSWSNRCLPRVHVAHTMCSAGPDGVRTCLATRRSLGSSPLSSCSVSSRLTLPASSAPRRRCSHARGCPDYPRPWRRSVISSSRPACVSSTLVRAHRHRRASGPG